MTEGEVRRPLDRIDLGSSECTSWPLKHDLFLSIGVCKYSRTQFIWINWDGEPFGDAENPDNLIFVCFLPGNSPASEFYMPTFRNTLFHLHRQVGK